MAFTVESLRPRIKLSITTRLANRLLGTPLIRNDIRGELVEEMVAVALEPEWQQCAGDWAAFDLKQADGPLRIESKPASANRTAPPRQNLQISATLVRLSGSNGRFRMRLS